MTSVLVEMDSGNAGEAREGAARAGLTHFHVVEADAALTDVYAPYRPADLVLACGIFGNISDADLDRYAIGVARLVGDPAPFTAGLRLFTFTR